MKEVEFQIDGKNHIAKVRKVTFGVKNEIEEAAVNIQIIGNHKSAKVSSAKMKEIAILKSVECSTYPLDNIQKIRELPADVGEILWSAFEEENSQNFQGGSSSDTQSQPEQ